MLRSRVLPRLAAAALAAGATVLPLPLAATADQPTLPPAGMPATVEAAGRWFPRDEQGRALVMRSFNIKLNASRLGEVTPAVLTSLRDNGFTLLRLATFWSDLEPTDDAWNTAYLADLGRVLDDADAAGVKVVLTMHQDSYSPAVGGFGMPDWTTRTDGIAYRANDLPCLEPANQRAWQHFWEDADLRAAHVEAWLKMVETFKDKPALHGYDLLNEPCGEARPGEGLGDALRRVEATQITPMLQRVTDAIRTLDTEHWIFLEGAYGLTSSLAEPGGLGPVEDPTGRQIYAPHLYDLGMEIGAPWNPASGFVDTYFRNIVSYPKANGIPLVVFEWGPQLPAEPNSADYVDQVLTGADRHTAGWSAFAYCKALAGWCQLDADGNPGAAMTDTVHVAPQAVAGKPLTIANDVADGRSTVEVDPRDPHAGGPSTFYFPLRRFPAGPTVRVEGLAEGDWSWSFDPATQTVSVTTASGAATAPYTIVVEQAPTISLAVTGSGPADTDGDGAASAGDVVTFDYEVTNHLDTEVTGLSITDPAATAPTCPATTVAAGGTVTCTGTHPLTAAEVAAGSVTSRATATARAADLGTVRARAGATVTFTPPVATTSTTAAATTTSAPTSTSSTPASTATTADGRVRRSGRLSTTGSDTRPLVLTGLAAVLVGAVLVGAATRRRRASR